MNILLVAPNPVFSLGNSAGIPSVFEFIKSLHLSGHRVYYSYPSASNPPDLSGLECQFCAPVPYSTDGRLESLARFINRRFTSLLVRKISTSLSILQLLVNGWLSLAKLAQAVRFDLVYCVSERPLFLAWLLSIRLHRPLVLRSYGLGMMPRLLNEKPLIFFGRMWLLWCPILLCRASAYIIVNDGNNSESVYYACGISPKRVYLLRNGYDPSLEVFRSMPSEASTSGSSRALNIGMCCRHDYEKRIDRLIAALPLLLHQRIPFKCHIAGSGPFTEIYKNLAIEAGVAGNVVFHGLIPRSALADFYSSLDVYVQLNQHSNFGNTLIESMLSECILITSLNDSQTQRLLASSNAAICLRDPDSAQELADAIINVSKNHAFHLKRAQRGHEVVKRLIQSWNVRAAQEVSILEAIVAA